MHPFEQEERSLRRGGFGNLPLAAGIMEQMGTVGAHFSHRNPGLGGDHPERVRRLTRWAMWFKRLLNVAPSVIMVPWHAQTHG